MKIDANIRVVKSAHATEVFISSLEPVSNFVLYLPPDASVKDGQSITFSQSESVAAPDTAAAALPDTSPKPKAKAAK